MAGLRQVVSFLQQQENSRYEPSEGWLRHFVCQALYVTCLIQFSSSSCGESTVFMCVQMPVHLHVHACAHVHSHV